MKKLEWPKTEKPWNGDLFSVQEWVSMCKSGVFIDYDGMGDLVIEEENTYKIVTPKKENEIFPEYAIPSKRHELPENITHILWYNK